MIGLGSNRLSVCRRGGMSVTQAGRGGMEWLAGGRLPSWASPYSAQATAALLAQFPTQWPTIRDYGFAHPEIVGYMNAYAPEDAKIAYSLVPTLGKRWIKGDGNSYIVTTRAIGTHPRIVIEDYYCTLGNACIFQPIVNGAVKVDGWVTNPDGNMYYRYGSASWNGTRSMGTITGQRMTLDLSEHMIRDGVEYGSAITGYNFASYKDYNMRIWGSGWAGSNTIEMGRVKMYDDATQYLELVPFIHDDNGTKKKGMIDLLSGTFYENQGSGSFTISETPAS